MKNLYLYSLLCGFLNFSVYSQNENKNWFFGYYTGVNNYNWVNFDMLLNPNNMSLPSFNGGNLLRYLEGCASVSDENGNLLFVTDGIRVYQKTGSSFNLITSGLKGNSSSTQNVIIVKKPNHPKKYYVFTIDGSTGEKKGLYYTEFDFTSGTGIVVPGTLNKILKDNLSNLIDENYQNFSEGITSVIDQECGYWVIAHVGKSDGQGNVFSYRVTENGVVNEMPSNTFDFDIPISPPPINSLRSIKISSNSERIGVGISGYGIFNGNFDNLNGSVSNLNLIPLLTNVIYGYSLEFSNDSNIIYASGGGKISRVNLVNNEFQTASTNAYNFLTMQLAVDNNIYVAATGYNKLLVLQDVNNMSNPLNLNNTFQLSDISGFGLPQKVWNQTQSCCQPTLITSNVINSIIHEERSDWIKTTDFVIFGDGIQGNGVVYHAGNFVELNPGFEADSGSQFSAYIEGCSNDYVYKNSSTNVEVKNDVNDIVKNKISIYPNPTSGLLNISLSNNKIKKVMLTSIEGKVYVFEQFDNSENVVLDLSNYSSGIYLINVETDQGEIINSKVIKN